MRTGLPASSCYEALSTVYHIVHAPTHSTLYNTDRTLLPFLPASSRTNAQCPLQLHEGQPHSPSSVSHPAASKPHSGLRDIHLLGPPSYPLCPLGRVVHSDNLSH